CPVSASIRSVDGLRPAGSASTGDRCDNNPKLINPTANHRHMATVSTTSGQARLSPPRRKKADGGACSALHGVEVLLRLHALEAQAGHLLLQQLVGARQEIMVAGML